LQQTVVNKLPKRGRHRAAAELRRYAARYAGICAETPEVA
jgi:hypothetical protein